MEAGKKKVAGKGSYRDRIRPPSQAFNYFLKVALLPFLWLIYAFHWDARAIKGVKPPFLVIANHDMNLDPFFVEVGFRKPAYIMSSEHLFRIKPLRFLLLNLVAAIPKTKAQADSTAIRAFLDGKRLGYPLLVFPETGGRNWGGQTSPVIPSTAKLVKLLKIPVVACIMEGAYLTTPRWGFYRRRGRLTARYHLALTAEEAATLPEAGILARLQASIDHDDNLWQLRNLEQGKGIVYRGSKRAEAIERSLYACPKCGTLRALRSEKHAFSCTVCGFGGTIDRYGLIDGTAAIRDYTTAVHGILVQRLDEHLRDAAPDADFLTAPMRCWTSHRHEEMRLIAQGELHLTRDRLWFAATDGGRVDVPIPEIRGITCFHAHILEFVLQDCVYRIILDDRHASVRLWQDAVKRLADLAKGGDSGIIEE